MNKKYFLDQDDDGHWYIIDANKEDEWNTWRDNYSEEDYEAPEFAEGIDSPSEIKFYLRD